MDTLIFMPDTVVSSKVEENMPLDGNSQTGSKDKGKVDIVEEEIEVDVEVEKIERPVDLYKVWMS